MGQRLTERTIEMKKFLASVALGCLISGGVLAHEPTPPPQKVTSEFVYRFAGYSTQNLDGANGLVGMYQECQTDFGVEARMCSDQEFFNSPNISAPITRAWVQPTKLIPDGVTTPATATIGMYWLFDYAYINCRGWTSNSSIHLGSIVGTSTSAPNIGGFGRENCNLSRQVTCCTPLVE